jgi:predicted glutamate--cysteine ligase
MPLSSNTTLSLQKKSTLLLKGMEEEVYTGTPQGDIVGLSDRIVDALKGFDCEPDSRNVEYVTRASNDYTQLLLDVVSLRLELRHYLKTLGNYTVVPGSTLSLGDTTHFYRSKPHNSYHTYIEQTYGTNVVTAGLHLNFGFDDPELLLRACRLIRVEACLFLALTAASPFLDGRTTHCHSTRWSMFPQTPTFVPLFESYEHYICWFETQLASGAMQNERHLWISVRPNGPQRPYQINRLELRICDSVIDPVILLAVTALLEARLWQLIHNPGLDPLEMSQLPPATRAEDLVALAQANEAQVARYSLEAEVRHWQDGRPIQVRDWLEQIYQECSEVAQMYGFRSYLLPLKQILQKGNTAQHWLKLHDMGLGVQSIIEQATQAMTRRELRLAHQYFKPHTHFAHQVKPFMNAIGQA